MTRVEFTRAKNRLIGEMIEAGEWVFEDYLKRSNEEQHRLFLLGLSKCDGYRIESGHQRGKAIDLCFMNEAGQAYIEGSDGKAVAVPPKLGWEYWHKRWEELGGKPMISWDAAHFEG